MITGILLGIGITIAAIAGFVITFGIALGGRGGLPWVLYPFYWIIDIFLGGHGNGLRNILLLIASIFIIWWGYHHIDFSLH